MCIRDRADTECEDRAHQRDELIEVPAHVVVDELVQPFHDELGGGLPFGHVFQFENGEYGMAQNLDLDIYVMERQTLIKLVKDATARGLIYFERDILAHNVNILNIHALEYTGYVAPVSYTHLSERNH